jgi:hypothetical protein
MTEPEDRAEEPAGHMHVVIGPGCQNVQAGGGNQVQANHFGPDEADDREEDRPVEEWDPGDEVDDEGGMSEFRYDWQDDPAWPEAGS